MNCPACRNKMESHDYLGTEIDQCPGCGGAWLDHEEIDQVFLIPDLPERLIATEVEAEAVSRVPEGHRTCPRCRTFLTVIEVDEVRLDICADCKGFFCDLGELGQLAQAAERRLQDGQS